MMSGSRKNSAWMQSNFYRDQFRKVLNWLIAAIFIILILIVAIIYQILVLPSQQYYANTTNGKILVMPQRM